MMPKFLKNWFKKSSPPAPPSPIGIQWEEAIKQFEEEVKRIKTDVSCIAAQAPNLNYPSVAKAGWKTSHKVACSGNDGWITYSTGIGEMGEWEPMGPKYEPLGLTAEMFEEICTMAKEYPAMHDSLQQLKVNYELLRKQHGIK